MICALGRGEYFIVYLGVRGGDLYERLHREKSGDRLESERACEEIHGYIEFLPLLNLE